MKVREDRLIVLIPTLTLLCAATVVAGDPVPGASFTGLGYLNGQGGWTKALGVSADGSTVVGDGVNSAGFTEAFRWTATTGLLGLGELPGGRQASTAYGVSAHGDFVVGRGDVGLLDLRAFLWSEPKGMVSLGVLPGAYDDSGARAVSADGTVVVGWCDGFFTEPIRWTEPTGVVSLNPNEDGRAYAISADGAVIVGQLEEYRHYEAFRWTEAKGVVRLGDFPGGSFSSAAFDVSADGAVIVGAGETEVGIEAAYWTESAGMVGLGYLPGGEPLSIASAVSANAAVIVGDASIYAFGFTEAFVWDRQHGMRMLRDVMEQDYGLDLSEWWNLRSATGISADGRTVVGYGTRFGQYREPWIAYLPPLCPGDINHDGVIDQEDLDALLEDYGCGGGVCVGDVDADGDTDLRDLGALLARFGRACP